MRIFLDDDDAPNPDDRETAKRIVEEIVSHDVFTRGSFVLEGYSVAKRIAKALTAARADERRSGFNTPFRMRTAKMAPGAPAVMTKRPNLRPLYHWMDVDGVRLQSYRAGSHEVLMISDDARITIIQRESFFTAQIDGVEVIECGLTRHYPTEVAAARAALAKIRL